MSEVDQLIHLHGVVGSGSLNYRNEALKGYSVLAKTGPEPGTLVISLKKKPPKEPK
jgi:hypothetical protein